MAHHSRYPRIRTGKAPILDEAIFWRKFGQLAERFRIEKINAFRFIMEHNELSVKYGMGMTMRQLKMAGKV